MNSDYASVTQQSGLKAGDGGFQVDAKGDTELKGGAITSTQAAVDQDRNSFKTGGTLTLSDIENKASYDAQSVAVNIGAGSSPTGKLVPGGTSAGFGIDSGDAASTTEAAISGVAGNTAARTGDAETGIGKIFDAGKVQKDIDAQTRITQQFTQQTIAIASVFAEEAYRTMFLKKVEVREILRDEHGELLRNENGELQTRVVPDEEKSHLQVGNDGKVHIASNGIFNNLSEATKNAQQNSSASGPQYLIVFPQADNAVSELLVAGYQKFLEGGKLELTNAAKENVNMLNQYGESGLHLDGHSRGSLTVQNALEFKAAEVGSSGSASNTSVSFYGPAANAVTVDQTLSALQSRSSVSDLQAQQDMVLKLQNHSGDPIGTIIGNNPGTGGTIPLGDNSFTEAMKALTGQPYTTHNCYGVGAPEQCGKYWGNGNALTPINQLQ